MYIINLLSFVAVVTLCVGLVTPATVPSTTEETAGIGLLNRCTSHSVCSCNGIAICHDGFCRCLFALTNTQQLDIEMYSVQPMNYQLSQFEHHQKRCSAHSDCSCMEGIAICHEGYCSCIFTQYICTKHQDCSSLCQSKIGICFYNACKCFNLVEDVRLSESISPMIDEVPPN